MAKKRAAGDSSTPTGTHASEKITLAANALRHLPLTPKQPPKFRHLRRSPWSVPGSTAVGGRGDGYFESAIMAVCPILYGAIHFLAWKDQFPTTMEALLWRISSVVVTITCSGFLGVIVFWGIVDSDRDQSGCVSILIILILGVSGLIIPISHILASGFLIVESFRQLVFLNPAAYQLPSWSNYWPHFS